MGERTDPSGEPSGAAEHPRPGAATDLDGADRESAGAVPSATTPWTAEQRYRWFVATAPEGIWRFELTPPLASGLSETELAAGILAHGRLAECNAAFARKFGFEHPGELRGSCVADILFRSRDEQTAVFQEFVRTGFSLSGRVTTERTRSGRLFRALHHLAGIQQDGWLTGGWGSVRDVTEEQALSASHQRFRGLFEASPIGVEIYDAEGRLELANRACLEMFGVTDPDEVHGFRLFEDPNLPDEVKARLREGATVSYEAPFDFDLVREQGLYRTGRSGRILVRTLIAPLLATEATPGGYLVQVEDVTERRRAEESLTSLAAAVEQAADDIVVMDAAGIITYVNSAFERTTGYARTEAVGRSPRFLDSGRHDEAFYRVIDATTASGRTWQGRFSNRTRAGSEILQEATISPILDPSGRIVGQVSARRDITRQVEMEEHAARADKLEAIGTLAGGIAHDFNNILSAIIGYTQMALRKCPEDSPIHQDLKVVLQGSRRATDLVKQILTFSRQEPCEERSVQIGSIVKEATRFLRSTIPATVEVRTDIRSNATVQADPTEIHRVVVNLCTNAALAMQDQGGLLELRLEETDLDGSFTAQHPGVSPGRFVRLTVRDTGQGIPREVQSHIFEPFFTTRERGKGSGMGLAVVHGIVTRCRGAIAVRSAPGQGAAFEVYLPALEAEAPADDPGPRPLATGTERVLVVDDEPSVAATLVDQLGAMGYRATACPNGPEALAEFMADPGAIDLVVTDMTMPGMTGTALAQRLKHVRPDLPVLLCTGYSEIITPETAREQGIDEFAMKPVGMPELSELVRKALDRR